MKDLSPIIVAADEARRHNLVDALRSYNVPATPSDKLPFDYMWTVDGTVVAGERKTLDDFIDSYLDERLHHQCKAMADMGAVLKFILLEGVRDNELVGRSQWTWDEFDNALLSVEMENVKLISSRHEVATPKRLASVWRYTGKEQSGSWHSPVPIIPEADPRHGVIFFDNTYRSQVGAIMHWPGFGLHTANTVRESMSFMDAYGITEEGLKASNERLLRIKGIGKKMIEARERWIRS